MTDHESNALPNNIDEALEGFFIAGTETLAEIRLDWRREKEIIRHQNREMQVDVDALLAPIKERIAKLEGQMEMLASSLNTNGQAPSKRLRQQPQQDNGRLSEAPRRAP
jgi:hypothetical protein